MINKRLGDDVSAGWLLLGSTGRAQNVGGVAAPITSGVAQSGGEQHESALAQQLAGSGGGYGSGGHGGSGGGTGARRSLP